MVNINIIMVLNKYFDLVFDGVEILFAIGSILGLLGLIVGLIGLLVMPRFQRHNMFYVIIISIILLIICGFDTGLQYFGIRI